MTSTTETYCRHSGDCLTLNHGVKGLIYLGAVLFTFLVAVTKYLAKQANGFVSRFESTVHHGEEGGAAGHTGTTPECRLEDEAAVHTGSTPECKSDCCPTRFLLRVQFETPVHGVIPTLKVSLFVQFPLWKGLMNKPRCLCCKCLGTVRLAIPEATRLSIWWLSLPMHVCVPMSSSHKDTGHTVLELT